LRPPRITREGLAQTVARIEDRGHPVTVDVLAERSFGMFLQERNQSVTWNAGDRILEPICSVESAEGVGISPLCTRFRRAAERIQRWTLGREGDDRDLWVDRSNSLLVKNGIIVPSEITIPMPSSDSTEQNRSG
jgi:hypothetical protein